MPIEECFSNVKSYLRSCDPLVGILHESEMEELILSAFASITADGCYGTVDKYEQQHMYYVIYINVAVVCLSYT